MNQDHHLPQFHVRLPRGYVNDPNGPIDLDGRMHLYFQSRSRVDLGMPVEWGHATSDDLVHWTLHRPAIAPIPGGADSDGIWSGNTVRHDGEIRAYYSGKRNDSIYQSVLMAVSHDGGATFSSPVQVVADPSPDEHVVMFRDPFVWRSDAGWEMALGAGYEGGAGAVRHYRSPDGLTWEFVELFATLPRTKYENFDTGEGWECPQILPVDGAEIALVGSWSEADGLGQVLAFPLGEPLRFQRVDDGQNFYAASVMRDSTWGPVLFGWVTEGRDADWARQAGWSGAISLPRSTWLDHGQLRVAPHPALDALRVGPPQSGTGAAIGAQAEIVLPEPVDGRIRLRFSDTEYLDVQVNADTVTIDRDHASSDPRAHGGQATAHDAFAPDAGRPALRLFLDGSILEAFTSSGRVLTPRVYPTTPPPWTVVDAPEGTQVWQLAPAVRPERVAGVESSPSAVPVG